MAIGIALLVAAILIFISSKGDSFGARLLATFSSLKSMLIQPVFRANGTFSVKGFTDVPCKHDSYYLYGSSNLCDVLGKPI